MNATFYEDVYKFCTQKATAKPLGEVCDKYNPNDPIPLNPIVGPISPNRRLKGAIEIYLPPDNPQLAAVELRECFPLDYLRSVFTPWKRSEGVIVQLKLRYYQQEAVDAVYRHLRERDDNPCVVIPTGGGKTAVDVDDLPGRSHQVGWPRLGPGPCQGTFGANGRYDPANGSGP